jgi:uncharacterized protein DUF6152
MRRAVALALAAALLGTEGTAFAHHSFAVFFDENKIVSVTGKVTEFRFINPHGLIALDVVKNGKVEQWKAETNAPVVLRRRGWAKDSIAIGETITIEGWASRDGKPYIRLRSAKRADGTPIGIPFDPVA